MTGLSKQGSLFDEIFRLQNTAPDVDVDPEDDENSLNTNLVDVNREEAEALGSTALRKRAAIIPDEPKYKGKKTSRKNLYSDDEEISDVDLSASFGPPSSEEDSGKEKSDDDFEKEDDEEIGDEDDDSTSEVEDEEAITEDEDMDVSKEETSDAVVLPSTKSDDREKGKVVHHQLAIWDDLIKSRISLQKVVLSCNRLPQPDTWPAFAETSNFRKEASNVHSSVRKVASALLELQQLLDAGDNSKVPGKSSESDEEITSESEGEDEGTDTKKAAGNATNGSLGEGEDEDDSEDEEMVEEEVAGSAEMADPKASRQSIKHNRLKRKLDVEDVEETLAQRHADFQKFRNDTLSKWDEKTRLIHGKIKSKNFAAFEMSVLKQIEQVLVNRERLVKRIHQQRSVSRVLGRPEKEADEDEDKDEGVDDEEEEVEIKQRKRSEAPVDFEIIDDSDFYHVCLRDLLENKQSEELDPVSASKQRLEIQRLRNKQKKKVDTRASKGRKIRYHVKEKLKNYMTPFDKSTWSDEQKDDLFKAVFGGFQQAQESQEFEAPTINIGI